ncbi:Uncharacterized protein involved in exopolysaccharide biosynthesis [Propionispira arboris]|uniref:Uncharacterized protein involved in exopolysaccharide biosynthesis n=1 Tax=Propionispira arboris TaxID=84035 RepID=A0A1H6U141_9FIRM|nr:GumC family protein [Propionispira arboris]SEI84214.1 Uncharacterized protein involved in exopolysaccharide biosynthesis [Propionispira arboris]
MDKEESIDLRELMQIVIRHKKIMCIIITVCTAIAMITAFFILPKTYESTTLVRAKSSSKLDLSGASAAMAALGVGGAATSPTMVYIELMKSRAVVNPIIEQLDLPAEKKENLTAKGFAKSSLEIINTKGTDLIEIKAKGESPEEAQQISQGVVDGFLNLMTQMNQDQQSLMAKFLSGRIDVARDDLDQATQKLDAFGQDKKVYVPEVQAKAEIEKMAAFDTMYSQLKVKEDSANAQLQSATSQLGKQNSALKEFNVADNPTIQKIRDSIVSAQVELVGLQQRYQDKHPDIIAKQQEIAELNTQLGREVSNYVDAGTVTMNPVQAGLIKDKVGAETDLAVTQASLSAIQGLQKKAEGDMSKLSSDSMEYIKLQRDVTIKQGIYVSLVQNYETARVQEAMNSMDIQIVDAADLPNGPSGPNKKLITAIGMLVGLIIAFGYTLLLYSKRR